MQSALCNRGTLLRHVRKCITLSTVSTAPYKAPDEISSKEFSGEFAHVVKNANARKRKKEERNRVMPRGGRGERQGRSEREKNWRNSLNFELPVGCTREAR